MGAGDRERFGGELALDFANTAGGRESATPIETLRGAADLEAWAVQANVQPKGKPLQERVMLRALDLREAIHRVGSALASSGKPQTGDLAVVVAEATRGLEGAALVRAAERDAFDLDFAKAGADDGLLGQIAWSAIRLLESGGFERLKKCPACDCGWLFYDRSKNNSRRWCDMATCGNRAKVRRSRSRPVREA